MRFNYFILLFWLTAIGLSAQSLDNQMDANRRQLESLKTEINRIREALGRVKNSESSVLKQIALIDEHSALIARQKGVLKQQSRLLQKQIQRTNRKLESTKQRLKQLKALYAKRLVYAYKYGRMRQAELLLSSASLNQAMIRYRYLKEIESHDRRTLQSIQKKKIEIEKLKATLKKDLKRKQQNLREQQQQEALYLAQKKEKNRLLKKIRWNRITYGKQLAAKEKEKENLIQILLELERQRQQGLAAKSGKKAEALVNFKFDNFRKAKGKLPWPVSGRVISKYGKHKDPKSKTYVKNTDIEIKSKLGTPVRCVFKGVVRVITYLPGYGNTVIVDHGSGYYTVYSHLDEIYVQKNSSVHTNQVIATVGDSGSLAGAKLQFGIYGKQKVYNPEKWLR